jgi:hypothetical protein
VVNQPAAHLIAKTWRLDRDLIAAVQAAAKARDEPVVKFVDRALRRELEESDDDR